VTQGHPGLLRVHLSDAGRVGREEARGFGGVEACARCCPTKAKRPTA
jgi:hypothetical protein